MNIKPIEGSQEQLKNKIILLSTVYEDLCSGVRAGLSNAKLRKRIKDQEIFLKSNNL